MISHLPNCPIVGPTLLANSPDWLKAAPMRENLLASWRQFGQKQDHCPSLLNHNAKYKRLLPPCCDFANGVGAKMGQLNSPAHSMTAGPCARLSAGTPDARNPDQEIQTWCL